MRPLIKSGVLLALMSLSAIGDVAPLTNLQYRVAGTQLEVSPAVVSVPKGIPGSVLAQLVAADGSTNNADTSIANGAYLEAILRGPSFPARRLVGQPGTALMLPPINLVGDYQLDGIRLVDSLSGATRLEGSPASVPVRVFDQVLISTVTSRPLTMQEITDKGIVIDANNFRAIEFEVSFVLDGRTIPVRLPVVAPDFQQSTEIIPASEMFERLKQAQFANDQLAQNLLESGSFPAELQRPGLNIQIKGANFQIAESSEPTNLKLTIPPIPALMVIPGNIGYLNQFFSVQIFTENGSPLGSGLSVFDLTAKLNLPPGPDGILSTNYSKPGDDPLRFARVGEQAEIREAVQLFGPAPDRAARLYPGQAGSAEFLVEGLQEGLHIMDLDLSAKLDGLAAGTVRISGKAAGSILVRNPKFSMTFSHPKIIRSGEPYTSYVTVLNTGSVEANLVSVTLRGASVSGGVLQSPEVVALGNIAPGQSATAAFRVLAQRTGAVKFSNLTTGENSVEGRFNLTMGIDERGVELSPDSIGMPDFVQYLPPPVIEAANRVLGQALSAATAPLLPVGVKPVSRATITRHILELAEAGQRIKYFEPTNRVLIDLMLDWQGGRVADDIKRQQLRGSSASLVEASTAPVFDEGFDQILRTTEAGRQFRAAILQSAESMDSLDATARLLHRAGDIAGRGEPWVLASSSRPELAVGATGAQGSVTPETSDIPEAVAYPGARGSLYAIRAATNVVRWVATTNVASAELAVLAVNTNGTGQQWRWTVSNIPAGACLRFDPAEPTGGLIQDNGCDGVPDATQIVLAEFIRELPPEVLTVVQDIDVNVSRPIRRCTPGPANSYGQVLGILFSKPMVQTNAAVPTAYALDNGNFASGVQVQPGGRVALISMREGVSAIRPRQLTVNGVTDPRGNPVVVEPKPVLTDFRDGIAVNGRVLRADGTPAAGVPVTVTMYDPWKDPFDRCNPTIITRTSQKYTDINGLFSFDFVHAGVSFTIAAVDTGGLTVEAIKTILDTTIGERFAVEKLAALVVATNAFAALGVDTLSQATRLVEGLDRAVWSDTIEYGTGRMGHEIVVGLRFRGRAIVSGTVLQSDGSTPAANAAVNLFPDPDSREQARGVFTDQDGRFEFNGVPLGQFTINVQNSQRNFRTIAGNLTQVGSTNHYRIVLTPPDKQELVRGSIRGRVVEPDGVTPHPGARVFVGYTLGVVAAPIADSDGFWQVDNIPVETYTVRAFSQDGRRKGEARGSVVTNAIAFVLTSLSGTGSVFGRVETSAGMPVPNAIIAGGAALVRTDSNGVFRLTGVPQGQTRISAGLEAQYAPGGFARVASATVNVLPDVENFAVIRLPAVGQIIGRVVDANGRPVTANVAIPMPSALGFAWVKPDGDGRFQFPNIAVGDYTVSSPAPPLGEDAEEILAGATGGSDDEIAAALQDAVTAINQVVLRRLGDGPVVTPGSFGWTTVRVRFDGDTAIANIQYLPEGKVNGTVVNDQGVPIGAAVRLTGPGLDGIGMPQTVRIGDRISDPASGAFAFSRLPQGSWALQVASPFYPEVLITNGFTMRDRLDVTNLVMRFPPIGDSNGRLAGTVFLPDGSPAGSGVRVKINYGTDYVIRTDENGAFDTQIKIPAGGYTLEAEDPLTGLRGLTRAVVRAGITNFTTVTLLGKGGLQLTVLQADGKPATNATVRATQTGFPGESFSGSTDANGLFSLANIFTGEYALEVRVLTGAGVLEAKTMLEVALGSTSHATVVLGPTGTISGVFRRRDDGTVVAGARISIGNAAITSTDSAGRFLVSGLNLGSYRVVGREPVSGRIAAAVASLEYNGHSVEVVLTELPQGELKGIVYQAGEAKPVAGARVQLSQDSALVPDISVTTGPDGSYSFPALIPGAFSVSATKSYGVSDNYYRTITGNYPDGASTLNVDIMLPARTVYGRVVVKVLEPDGVTPAGQAKVNDLTTNPEGEVIFDNLRLSTHHFIARSTATNQTSSVGSTTVTLSGFETNVTGTIVLSGVGRVRGRVLQSDGLTPAVGALVTARGLRQEMGFRAAQVLSNNNGEFEFDDFPIARVELGAVLGPLATSGGVTITNAGQTVNVTLTLGGSGSILGRLLRADGMTPVTGLPVTISFTAPSGLDGVATTSTDGSGRFGFNIVPVGNFQITAIKPDVDGMAIVRNRVSTNGQVLDLGDVRLVETWPEVSAVTPATGASGVSTLTPVEIVFSEQMATNMLFANGVYLRSPTNVVPCDLAWDAPASAGSGTLKVRLLPKAPLHSQTTYRVFVLAGVLNDGFGAFIGQGPLSLVDRPLLAPFISSFTTRDDDPPRLVSLFPTNQATQVDPLAVPRLSFNEPIRSEGLVISLSGPGGPIGGSTSLGFNGTVLTFTPSNALPINTVLTFSVSNIADTAGNRLSAQPVVSTFYTLDTLGPIIASVSRTGAAAPVPGTAVQVEAQLAATEAGVSVRFTRDFTPLGQATNAPYRVLVPLTQTGATTIRAIATDRWGNDGPVAELVINVVENQAPIATLTRANPAEGPVRTGQGFTLKVSATDDVGVTNVTVTGSGALSYSASFPDGAERTLPFAVPADAVPGSSLQFKAAATDLLGIRSLESILNLEIQDATSPSLLILEPNNDLAIRPDQPLRVTIASRDNSPSHQLQFVLTGALQSTQMVSVASAPNVFVTNIVNLDLAGAPTNGASFTLAVRASDSATNSMVVSRTYALADLQPPRILAVTPTNGVSGQSLWTRWTLDFDEPIATASVNSNGVRLLNSSGQTLPTTWQWVNSNQRLIIQARNSLQPGSVYTNVILPGLADASGNLVRTSSGELLPESGLLLGLTTASIWSISPPDNTPIKGGTNLTARVDFDPGLGAQFVRFSLTNLTPITVSVAAQASNVIAQVPIPYDYSNAVLHVVASDDLAFSKPITLAAIALQFTGNVFTNEPPSVLLTRSAPVEGPLASGMIFSLGISASDDVGITNMTLSGSGAIQTNITYANGASRSLTFKFPTGSPALLTQQFKLTAHDQLGLSTERILNLAVLPAVTEIPGNYIVFSRATLPDGAIYLAALDGSDERQITVGAQPRLSPDGRYLAYHRDNTNYAAANVYVRDLLLGDERLVVGHSTTLMSYGWYGNSERLVFDYGCSIADIARDGSGYRVLLNGNCLDRAVSVNPIDGRIAWMNSGAAGSIRVASLPGGTPRPVAGTVPANAWPSWSLDGEWLSFLDNSNGGNFLRVRPDGTGLLALTAVSGTNKFFAPGVWSQDGTRILAAGLVNGTNGLFAISTDGSGFELLSEGDFGFVGGIRNQPAVLQPPQLVSVTPASGSLRQSLWLGQAELLFTRAVAATSTSPAAVRFTNSAGALFSYGIENSGTRVLVKPALPLLPGLTYTNLLLPGLTGISGLPVLGPDGKSVPAGGIPLVFGTASILDVQPADGSVYEEGAIIEARIDFESGLGADAFLFQVDNNAPIEVPVLVDATSVRTNLSLPFGVTNSVVIIDALKTGLPSARIAELAFTLNPTKTNAPIVFQVTNDVTMAEGELLAFPFTANSSAGSMHAVDIAESSAPFALVQNLAFSGVGTNGSASGEVLLSPRAGDAGSYSLALRGVTSRGVSAITNIAISVVPAPTLAVTRWKDPVSGNWSDTNRWTAGLPSVDREAIIDEPGTYTVSMDVDVNVKALRLGGASGTQRLVNSSRTLTINEHSRFETNSVFQFNGGGLTGAGAVQIFGQMSWIGGNAYGAGRVIIASQGSLVITNSNGKGLDGGRVVENHGTARWFDGDLSLNPFSSGGSGRIENKYGAVFEIQADNSMYAIAYGDVNSPPPSFVNFGTVRKLGTTGTISMNVPYGNHGTTEILTGGWTWTAGMTNGGEIEISSAARGVLNGSAFVQLQGARFGSEGPMTLQAGSGRFPTGTSFTNAITVLGGTWFFDAPQPAVEWTMSAGELHLNAAQLIHSLNFNGGNLGGTNQVTIRSNLTWSGGTLFGSGRTVIAATASLVLTNAGQKGLDGGRVLENRGIARWYSGNFELNPFSSGGSGRIENAAGGTWEIWGDNWVSAIGYGDVNSPAPSFSNAGTVRKAGGTGVSAIAVPLLNSGSLEILAGTASLTAGMTNSGSFSSATAGSVIFNGGIYTGLPGASFAFEGPMLFQAGSGTFDSGMLISSAVSVIGGSWIFNESQPALDWRITGGDVQFNAAQIVDTLRLESGNLGGTNQLTIRSNMLWSSGTLFGSGRAIIAPGAFLSITNFGGKGLDGGRVLENRGVARWYSGNFELNPFSWGGSGTIENGTGGLFEIYGDSWITATGYGDINSPAPQLINAGTLRKLGGAGTTTLGIIFSNSGVIEVLAGTLNWTGGLTNSGSITAAPGATISLNGGRVVSLAGATFSTSGALLLQSGSGVFSTGTEVKNGVLVTGGSWVFAASQPTREWTINNGDVQFNESQTIDTLTFNNGSIGGTNNFVIRSNMAWSGGTIYGPGRAVVAAGAVLTMTNSAGKGLDGGRVLENQGITRWYSGELQLNPFSSGGSGRIENGTNGLWEIFGDNSVSAIGYGDVNFPPPSLLNAGLIRKIGGSGSTTVSIHSSNEGQIDLEAGSWNWNAGLTNSGNINTAEGTTLVLSGGSFLFTGTGALTLGGSLNLSGGSGRFEVPQILSGLVAVNNGDWLFNAPQAVNRLQFNAGNIGGTSTLSINGSFIWSSGTMFGSGRTVIAPGATLSLTNTHQKGLDGGRVLENQGIASWYAGELQLNPFANGGSGRIENTPSGVWELYGDNGVSAIGYGDLNFPPPSFVNAGTFRKVGGTGVTTLSVPVVNAGLVGIVTGAVTTTHGVTNEGLITSAAGTALTFNGGNVVGTGLGAMNLAGGLTLASGSGTFNVPQNWGGTVILNSGEWFFNAPQTFGRFEFNAGNLTGTNTVTVTNSFVWTGGTMYGSGRTVVAQGAMLILTNNPQKGIDGGRVLENQGTARWYAGDLQLNPFSSGGSGRIENGPSGVWEMYGDNGVSAIGYGDLNFPPPSIVNAGTFRKLGGTGASTMNVPVVNAGFVDILSGTFSTTQGMTNEGAINSAAGTSLVFNGGNVTGTGLGTMNLAGNLNLASGSGVFHAPQNWLGTVAVNNGDWAFNAAQAINRLEFNAGNLTGTNTVTVTNSFVWSSGTMYGSGRTVVAPGATLILTNNTQKGVDGGRVLENQGTARWYAGELQLNPFSSGGSGRIENGPSGVWEMYGDNAVSAIGYGDLNAPPPSFNNKGILRKTAGTGTTQVSVPLANGGSVELLSGTLALSGNGDHTGTFNITPPGMLRFASGTHNLAAGTQFLGTGTNQVHTSLVLQAPVNFGTTSTIFENSATLAGDFLISNEAGGNILFAKTMTIPGSLTAGGAIIVTAANITVTVNNTFTLLATGTLNNPGTFRVRAFDDLGGTIIGNAPVIFGGSDVVRIDRLTFGAAQSSALAAAALGSAVTLEFQGPHKTALRVQMSTDLRTWKFVDAKIEEVAAGRYRAAITSNLPRNCYFRIVGAK